MAAARRHLVASAVSGALLLAGLAGLSAAPNAHAESVVVAHGSARQVYATDVPPGASVTLLDPVGATVETRTATAEGGVVFREVAPGDGYRLRLDADGTESDPVTVHTEAAAPWNPEEVYSQSIPDDGYGYITTRDGTQLAYSVHTPLRPATLGVGLPAGIPLPSGPAYTPPYPTLIEYSGYGYAKPDGPVSGIAVLANLMGFAVVDVNMRGTGCSGGSYDFFEPLQSLDAYDVIETIARQPWVKGHRVGMFGISYGGISQLHAARLNPPSLAAISPLSVIDSVPTTLYPGGILNHGFALNWAEERAHEALPASPDTGQPYAWERIQGGDQTCAANQALHGEAVDLLGKVRANEHYVPEVADPLDPITFVDQIEVPVFMACQWQDEQTGGHCPMLARHLTGTDKKWFTFTNGAHIDSLDPTTFNRLYDFLSLYVAKEAPLLKSVLLKAAAPPDLPAGDGTAADRAPDAAQRPDPAAADLPGGAQGVRGAAAGAGAVRERRRPLGRPALPALREELRRLPGPRHRAAVALPAPARHDVSRQADRRPRGHLRLRPRRGAAHHLHRADRRGWAVGRRLSVVVELAAAPRRQRRVVAQHRPPGGPGRRRRWCRPGLGEVLDGRRRPDGDGQRDPARRHRGLGPERMAARERPQAVLRGRQHLPASQHAPRAGAELRRGGRPADARRPLREGDDPALLLRPRLPRGLADPADHLRAERIAADLGVRGDPAGGGYGDGQHRALADDAVAACPAGDPR